MEVKTCNVSNWKTIPANAQITAIAVSGVRVPVCGSSEALACFCNRAYSCGWLKPGIVRLLNFPWIRDSDWRMHFPTRLQCGLYLEQDGTGLTPILRMALIVKQLRLPSDVCILEYSEDDPGMMVLPDDEEIQAVLDEWNDAEKEPEDQVRKRIHELDDSDFCLRNPYKLSVGGAKFSVDGWAGLVNSFVAWICRYYRNGPAKLREIQESKSWKFGEMLSKDGHLVRLKEMDGPHVAASCMRQLMEAIGMDRYSLYVKCATITDRRSPERKKRQEAIWHEDLMKVDSAVMGIDEKYLEELCSKTAVVQELPSSQEVKSVGRHFSPAFRVII